MAVPEMSEEASTKVPVPGFGFFSPQVAAAAEQLFQVHKLVQSESGAILQLLKVEKYVQSLHAFDSDCNICKDADLELFSGVQAGYVQSP